MIQNSSYTWMKLANAPFQSGASTMAAAKAASFAALAALPIVVSANVPDLNGALASFSKN